MANMQMIRGLKKLAAVGILFALTTPAFSQILLNKLGTAFPLMSGQDITSWNQKGNANWSAISPNGVAADQGAGLLVGRLSVTDFQLQFTYWLDKDTRFSIFAHCVDTNYIASDTALEINLSSSPDKKYGTGSVIGMFHSNASPAKVNQWNDVTISSISNQLTITINGIPTVDKMNYNNFLSGPFAMKYGGGQLKITNVYATIPGRW